MLIKSFTSYQAWCLFASLAYFSSASPVSTLERDVALVDRETGCIALGTCPGMKPPPPSPSSDPTPAPTAPSSPSSAPSAPSTSPPPATTPTQPTSGTDGRKGPDPTLSIARAAMTPYLYGCDGKEDIVRQAWSEANTLAQAHKEWVAPGWGWIFGGKWQSAMDMYLGTDSSKDRSFLGGDGPLKENTLRQSGIHESDSRWSPYWSYTYMYCNESQVPRKPNAPMIGECGKPNTPGKKVAAYTFSDDGTVFGWNAKYVVLCPRFFDNDILTLADATANAKQDNNLARIMDNWRKVKARVMFHETYHWSPEVSIPKAVNKPEIYDPAQVVQLAKDSNVAKAKLNAESWAQAALAIYLQKEFGLKDPPVPESMAATQNITGVSSVDDDIEEKWLDAPPDGFDPPVPVDASSFAPPTANVVMIDGSAPTAPNASSSTSSSSTGTDITPSSTSSSSSSSSTGSAPSAGTDITPPSTTSSSSDERPTPVRPVPGAGNQPKPW